MKEKLNIQNKIIAFIGIYGSLILSLNMESKLFSVILTGQAIIYLCRYSYLVFKK